VGAALDSATTLGAAGSPVAHPATKTATIMAIALALGDRMGLFTIRKLRRRSENVRENDTTG
jgi:hypothetical protein